MFAIVTFKWMNITQVIPLAWIYEYKVDLKIQKTPMITFYSTDENALPPPKADYHSNKKHKIPENGFFYKVFVDHTFGELFYFY